MGCKDGQHKRHRYSPTLYEYQVENIKERTDYCLNCGKPKEAKVKDGT